ncbi:DUF397 domain-containing protein [Streptomyces umbrinus]|uniref:DUF397 domain-containing protein n=1 Tax=Streptomyces umbrinus TaxID=67370 RepID=UPI0027D80E81|nr:DUF397 domain-containing protein [Streptomyces umbrinus]
MRWARWFTSSYSNYQGGNCVEVADLASTSFASVAVRDSKAPDGLALLMGPSVFGVFVRALR